MAVVDDQNLNTVKAFVTGVLDTLSAHHARSAKNATKKLARLDPKGHRRLKVIGQDRSFLDDAEKEVEHLAWNEFESTTAMQDIQAVRDSLTQSTNDVELCRSLYLMMFVAGYSAEPLQELFTIRGRLHDRRAGGKTQGSRLQNHARNKITPLLQEAAVLHERSRQQMNSADALAKETIAAVYGDVEKRQRVLKIEFLTDRERERLERRLADALRSTRPEESSPIRWPPKWRMLIVRRRLRQVPVAKKPARSRRRLASRRRV